MPISKNITPYDTSQVNAALRAIVAETPPGTRYVNPDGYSPAKGRFVECRYVDRNNKGSCLVGRVAERLGIPLPDYGSNANGGIISDHMYFGAFFTFEATERLQTVQRRQDDGETWRRAIR